MSKRLLIVDDEPNLLRAVAACLKAEGYQVSTARSGREALIETPDRVEGFRAGVDAYLTKPFEPEELIAVVNGILNRVERTHAQIARLVSSSIVEEAPLVFQDEELTEAEDRVALAVSRGLSNKEIAAELEISVRTVENHISHILDKKGFNNRVEIARYVLEQRHSH